MGEAVAERDEADPSVLYVMRFVSVADVTDGIAGIR